MNEIGVESALLSFPCDLKDVRQALILFSTDMFERRQGTSWLTPTLCYRPASQFAIV